MGVLSAQNQRCDQQSYASLIDAELSWLAFNKRVLEEAQNTKHPLLERVRFLSISASNLDEFFMVRIAPVSRRVHKENPNFSDFEEEWDKQFTAITEAVYELVDEQQSCWRELRERLKPAGIQVVGIEALNKEQKTWLEKWFESQAFPVLTPIAVDPAHPFPFIPNAGIFLVFDLRHKIKKRRINGIIAIPKNLRRFIPIPKSGGLYCSIEEVICTFLDRLFSEYKIKGKGLFRLIRDSEIALEENVDDILSTFETALKKRQRGRLIQLTTDSKIPASIKKFVLEQLNVRPYDCILVNGIVGLDCINELISDSHKSLQFRTYNPRFPERIKDFKGNCFAAIKAKDFIVHHPFESFEVVIQFLRQAACDPNVVAIKQTLYRTSEDSPIIEALIEAAEAGKAVTAMVELKARFDEAANIRWARDLERAGVQVVFGFVQLKTHAKVSMVVRREGKTMSTYTHFGTGNYHPVNARIYTDLSFFTCNADLGRDVARLFNYMTGYAAPKRLRKLSIAPLNMRERLESLIKNEILNARKGKPAQIWAKMNALTDERIIKLLYKASQNGVKIALVIRGICCLRPGVPGLSDNIRVKSIIGRFLEHSRIICFADSRKIPSSKSKVFLSSADWMPRNLDRRVETMVPIENATVRKQLLEQIMIANLNDVSQSWQLGPDGIYRRLEALGDNFSAHEYFMSNPSLSGRGSALKISRPIEPLTLIRN